MDPSANSKTTNSTFHKCFDQLEVSCVLFVHLVFLFCQIVYKICENLEYVVLEFVVGLDGQDIQQRTWKWHI